MKDKDFENIITQYRRLVFSICLQFTGNYHDAQNLAQETFVTAYFKIDDCKAQNRKAWLSKIAVNKCKDFLKSAYSRHTELSDAPVTTDRLAPSAEQTVLDEEAKREIQAQILSLKEPYIRAAKMVFLEGKTVDETATALGRPPNTVKTQLRRARQIIKSKLGKEKD